MAEGLTNQQKNDMIAEILDQLNPRAISMLVKITRDPFKTAKLPTLRKLATKLRIPGRIQMNKIQLFDAIFGNINQKEKFETAVVILVGELFPEIGRLINEDTIFALPFTEF